MTEGNKIECLFFKSNQHSVANHLPQHPPPHHHHKSNPPDSLAGPEVNALRLRARVDVRDRVAASPSSPSPLSMAGGSRTSVFTWRGRGRGGGVDDEGGMADDGGMADEGGMDTEGAVARGVGPADANPGTAVARASWADGAVEGREWVPVDGSTESDATRVC